ncbi:MAG: hypothetical protein LBI04_09380 [Treponema sp.]|jgi:hypothetical protein|nr:hypothetical protein [Treponema sp.]
METKELFEKISQKEIEAYSSTYVIEELDKASEPKRSTMLDLITQYKIIVLEIDKRAYDLSETYIEMGIIPLKFRIDGIHIAMAAIHDYGLYCQPKFSSYKQAQNKNGNRNHSSNERV